MSYRRLRDHQAQDELLGGVTKRARHWSTPKIPVPPPPPEIKLPEIPPVEIAIPPMPAPFDPEAAEAKRRKQEELRKLKEIEARRRGYSRTLLTGGQGVTEEAPVNKPRLIGR